jgi:hypothetical protein
MNDDIDIETLGLKDLKFIEDQIKAIESQLDVILEEGFEKELAPEPWQDSDKHYGYIDNPDLFKRYMTLSKQLTSYERRRRAIEIIRPDEEPRMGLSIECQDAFDRGVEWENSRSGREKSYRRHDKLIPYKQLLLLVAEERWLEEGDENPTHRDELLIEFSGYTSDQWHALARKHKIKLQTVPDEWKPNMTIEVFRLAKKQKLIHVPPRATHSGRRPRK